MNSYTSMKSKLMPLGLYTMAQGSAVDCELKAYAEGLDVLFDTLDEMAREAFIPTAEDYGISEREKFCGRERADLSLEKRREALLKKELSFNPDKSIDGFKKLIEDCGVTNYELNVYPSRCKIVIKINDELSAGQRAMLEESVKNTAPVHFTVTIS